MQGYSVKITPNPRYEIFVAESKQIQCRFSKWRGIAFRAAPLEFARIVKLLDGKGGLKLGGRWLDGSTPLQVVERGETDRVWRMIYELESGEPG